MTDLTDEAVKALLDRGAQLYNDAKHHLPLQARCADLARALLDARAELSATQTQLGDWIVRADEANVRAEKAEAELAAAQQREGRMTDPLMGMMVKIVEPDTVVGKDDKDQDMIVTDTNIVCNGNRMWVTQTVWDKMKEKSQ